MKYPKKCNNVIDITKPPYNADNTGKSDCTAAIRRALDDVLCNYPPALDRTRQKLLEKSKGLKKDAYVGYEAGRVIDGFMTVTLPEFAPEAYIIYFPSGTYLVSDTVSYTVENICTLQQPEYMCELCRNIHIAGESVENTVIRLKDASQGFDGKKPIISFDIKAYYGLEKETTNCAQMNTLEDITVDTGKGNDGAIGVLYVSSNCGRIENVRITGNGYCGIATLRSTEGCFKNITVDGFEYGLDISRSSPVIAENIFVSGNRRAGIVSCDSSLVCRNIISGNIIGIELKKGVTGRYFLYGDVSCCGDTDGNRVYRLRGDELPTCEPFPEKERAYRDEDCAFVDDFGASGDGRTDSAQAIQRAMDSGKSIIVFGKGTYLLEDKVTVPRTVRTVDFMWCNLISGAHLVTGELDAAFEISEDAETPVYMAHLMTHEQFSGHFRFVKHSAKRDAVFKDIATVFCAQYFNTVSGSNVFFDNCFQTVGTYSQDIILKRKGYIPTLCGMIPYEFHGQRVRAKNLNAERADVELLNDASDIYIDGYKTEGPGVAVRAVNGGKTRINIFQNGIWKSGIENAIFEAENSEIKACGGSVSFFNENRKYSVATDFDGKRTDLFDISTPTKEYVRIIDRI